MAETAGLVIGAVGVVSLANTVSDCFASIESARNLGVDFVQLETELHVARLKYARWVKTLRTTNSDGSPNVYIASVEEVDTVKRLLGGIEVAFEKASKSASSYMVKEAAQNATSDRTINIGECVELAVRIKNQAERQQKHSSLLRKAKWNLHDAKALRALVATVSSNVATLVDMFPATRPAQQHLASEDVKQIAPEGGEEHLELLAAVAMKTDPIMKGAADAEAQRRGHSFRNMKLEEKAKALYGDDLAPGAKPFGLVHDFHNISAGGEVRVHYGNRLGYGASFLDG